MSRYLLIAVALAALSRDAFAQPSPPRARIVEDLRLDANTEDFNSAGVGQPSVSPHGRLLVPQSRDYRVLVYDSTGKRLWTAGRRGSGPGEFQTQAIITGWVADTAWVYDGRQRRLAFFAPGGKVLRVTPVALGRAPQTARASTTERSFFDFRPHAVLGDGSMIGPAVLARSGGNATPAWPERHIVSVDRRDLARSLVKPPANEDDRWFLTAVPPWGDALPFAALPEIAYSPSGDRFAHMTSVATSATGGTFTVSVFRATGEQLFARTFPFTGVPIPQRLRDSAAMHFITNPDGMEGPPDLGARLKSLAEKRMPRVYPGVESLLPGSDNTTWIGLRPRADGRPFLVLDRQGIPLASVVLHPNDRLLQANASRIWVAERDSNDMTSIVRYRVAGIPCAPAC